MPDSGALNLLRIAVLAMAGGVLLLLAAVLCQHAWRRLTATHRRRREATLTPLLYGLLQDPAPEHTRFGRLSRADRRIIRDALLRLSLDIRGDAGDAIQAVYRDLGLLAADAAGLRSRRAARRARAAADLGLVGATDALPALRAALDDPDLPVRRAAVWAVGQVGDRQALAELVSRLGDPSENIGRRVQEVVAVRGHEVEQEILDYVAATESRPGRLAGVELIGWLRIAAGVPLLLRLIDDPDAETRIKSVKAAAAIGDPRFLAPFHERLRDAQWEVRCQAAKGLGVLGSPTSVPHLDAALRDQQWWVRFYAAAALAEIGSSGAAALTGALADPEPKVAGMARYLLERGHAVPALP